MAARRTHSRRRVNSHRTDKRRVSSAYEDGNALRQAEEAEEEELLERETEEEERKRKEKARRARLVRRNRAIARRVSAGQVFFFFIACGLALGSSVIFLKLRTDYIRQTRKIASMETTLNQLRTDNDALYNEAKNSVTIDDVKDTALNELGMHYADESQIRYYNTTDESYVRQYTDVSSAD